MRTVLLPGTTQTTLMNDRGQMYSPHPLNISHSHRVKQQLRQLGLSKYALMKTESRYLPKVIHENEEIGGVVYGRTSDGFAMIIATDRRIIFLDKKPAFINLDEINYYVVSGITINNALFESEVILHTKMRDYTIRTLNESCARRFVEYIEARSLENIANDTEQTKAFMSRNGFS